MVRVDLAGGFMNGCIAKMSASPIGWARGECVGGGIVSQGERGGSWLTGVSRSRLIVASGGPLVLAGLVEMAFDHCNGVCRWMALKAGEGEASNAGDQVATEGCFKGGKSRAKERCMGKGNQVGRTGRGLMDG